MERAEKFFDESLQSATHRTPNSVSVIFVCANQPLQILTPYRSGCARKGTVFITNLRQARELVSAGVARYLELNELIDQNDLWAPIGFQSRIIEMIKATEGMPFGIGNPSLVAIKVSAAQVQQHQPMAHAARSAVP